MPYAELLGLAGLGVAAFAMLVVTQTKNRVSWPAWLVPTVVVVPFVLLTAYAAFTEGLFGFGPMLTDSAWGLQVWFDRLMAVAAAFFLLQNRARAAGMKSEVWVLVVIATGSIGLFLMLARTVYLERERALRDH